MFKATYQHTFLPNWLKRLMNLKPNVGKFDKMVVSHKIGWSFDQTVEIMLNCLTFETLDEVKQKKLFEKVSKVIYLTIVTIYILTLEIFNTKIGLTLIDAGGWGGGAIIIHHRRIAFFSATKHRMNLGPVCKFKFCRCGPVEKKQSALSVSV